MSVANGTYVWKFMISPDEWIQDPDEPTLSYKGVVCACIATTEKKAREHVARFAAENGLDSRWLKVARIIRLPVKDGTFIAWAEV